MKVKWVTWREEMLCDGERKGIGGGGYIKVVYGREEKYDSLLQVSLMDFSC